MLATIGRVLVKLLVWGLVLGLIWGVSAFIYEMNGGTAPAWMWVIFGLFLAGYISNSVSEWGQEVLVLLRDIRARLPDREYQDYP